MEFLHKEDKKVYADMTYLGKEIATRIPKHIKNKIIEKRYKNKPFTKRQDKKRKIKISKNKISHKIYLLIYVKIKESNYSEMYRNKKSRI